MEDHRVSNSNIKRSKGHSGGEQKKSATGEQEFTIRAVAGHRNRNAAKRKSNVTHTQNSKSEKKKTTILGRFLGSKRPTFSSSKRYSEDADEWTMKAEVFQDSISSWTISREQKTSASSEVYKGVREGGLTGSAPSNYFILIKEKGDFVAVPVDEWVTFRQVTKRVDLSLEEAEAAMKHRRLEAEKEDPVSVKGVGEDVGKRYARNSGTASTQQKKNMENQEPDSDEEWKNVGSSGLAGWKLKLNSRRNVDDEDHQKQQETALDFKDEYKPEDAEDWEHEIAADDDDLDMGDDSEQEADVPPVQMNQGALSPSGSGDDGELSDGGMGDRSVRQKLKRVLRANNARTSDDEEEDSDGEGPSSSDDDDDDVDALDAMASRDLPMVNTVDDKKRKLSSPQRTRDENDNNDEQQPVAKRQKPEDLLAKVVPQDGVPSEEEIKSLLEKEGRMLLADIAAAFKKRLKSGEDRKLFTSRVKAVAMLDPNADGKKRYLILRK